MAELTKKHKTFDTEKEKLAIKCQVVFVRINEYGEAIRINDNVRTNYPELS